MYRAIRTLGILAVVMPLAGCIASRQAPAPQPPSATAARTAAAKGPKSYDQVITRQAETDDGLFKVHKVGAKLYYEVPDSLLGRDMLLISRIAQAPTDFSPFVASGLSVAEQLVRWERVGDRVLLRKYSFRNIADDSLPIHRSVASNNFAPILYSFDVEAVGPDGNSVVIDVTDLFKTDVPAISGLTPNDRNRFKVRRLDPSRTLIDSARSFPLNVDVRHTLTFEAAEPPSDRNTGTLSLQMHQSMVLLPKEPMRVRYADPRVGWFTITQVDFGSEEQKAATRRVIRRWRLEPKDPEAYARGELVEPVKPIVYYIDPATPEKWRPYFKKGVEDWQKAFEAAGFKNAIIAKDPPSPEEDPDWNPEDVRYSVIRYVANMTRNAMGPSVSDPRSGEIIESDIVWYHNHLRSYRNRLMIETGAANPAARSLMIPEELIGETMRQVIAHEVGHALGLPHNMGASSAFPVDSLRSPTFTEKYGVSPSIMDYARQNYVAQPGDGVTRFVRKIGPYDHYAIRWGYSVIPGAETPEAEKPTLDRWILEKAGDPVYRFANASATDPRSQTEDIGDDPVRASGFGIENLKRVVPNLVEWTATEGQDYTDLAELYGELVSMWNRYIGHVITNVGGVYEDTKTSDQEGVVYRIVPRSKQREAVQFLTAQVFETPTWLLDEDLLRRIEGTGAIERIRRIQVSVVDRLLDPARLQRLIEAEAFNGTEAYRLTELMGDLKRGIWGELATGKAIDVYRRNLQRGHLARLASLMEDEARSGSPATGRPRSVDVAHSDIRPVVRAQLLELRAEAARAASRTRDAMTRMHLQDIVARIDAVLEPTPRRETLTD